MVTLNYIYLDFQLKHYLSQFYKVLYEKWDLKTNLGNVAYCIPCKNSFKILKDVMQKTLSEWFAAPAELHSLLERFNGLMQALWGPIKSEVLVGAFKHSVLRSSPGDSVAQPLDTHYPLLPSGIIYDMLV